MSQSAYLQNIVSRFEMANCKGAKTPFVTNLLLMRRAVRFLVQNTEVL